MRDTRQRAKRDERLDPPPKMRLTARDLDIIEAIYRYRVLTQTQIQRLLFPNHNPNVANRRLFLLYHNAYVERQFLLNPGGMMTSPILYLLDKRGGEALLQQRDYTEIRWKARHNQVGDQHLRHLLYLNTFRLEIELACQHHQIPLQNWLDDTTLHQDYDRVTIPGYRKPQSIIPDGYFQVLTADHKSLHFFVELDGETMDLGRFKRKIQKYLAWEKSGLVKQRFQTTGYRVLTVTLSTERLHNLRQATHAAGGQNKFWFGVLTNLTAATVFTEPQWWLPTRDQPVPLINATQLAR